VKPEEVGALEKQVGYARVMEMFRNIGVRMGEDKFVSGSTGTGPGGVMSREQAAATLAEKMNDNMWAARLNARDATAMMEFNNLTRLTAGQ
jgi:hypothetical protein